MRLNNLLKATFVAAAGLMIATSSAEAARRTFNLDYRGQIAQNGQSALLNRDIQRMYGVDTSQIELVSVTAEVKSIDPFGDVQLRVGWGGTNRQHVQSRPQDWMNPADYTYDPVPLWSPSRELGADWALEFIGRAFKVSRVMVEVDDWRGPVPRPRPRPQPPRPQPPHPGPGRPH